MERKICILTLLDKLSSSLTAGHAHVYSLRLQFRSILTFVKYNREFQMQINCIE